MNVCSTVLVKTWKRAWWNENMYAKRCSCNISTCVGNMKSKKYAIILLSAWIVTIETIWNITTESVYKATLFPILYYSTQPPAATPKTHCWLTLSSIILQYWRWSFHTTSRILSRGGWMIVMSLMNFFRGVYTNIETFYEMLPNDDFIQIYSANPCMKQTICDD